MLLVLNFFFWEIMVFVFIDVSVFGNGNVFFKDIFDDVIIMFKSISDFFIEFGRLFVSV